MENMDENAAEWRGAESCALPATEQCEAGLSGECSVSEWSDGETRLLLDKYEAYLPAVGPMKKFKRKKDMWKTIAQDLKNILQSNKTALQCENRYKTILKRKKRAVENNNTTGASRQEIPFESELQKINAIDDSIEPEIRIDSHQVSKKATEPVVKKSKSATSTSDLIATLNKIHEEREAARERRHKEKMKLLERLLSDSTKSNVRDGDNSQ